MAQYKVFANGYKMGIFEGETEDAALEAYAQEAGYQSVADMDEQLGSEAEYDVVEVEADASDKSEEEKKKKFKIVANRFDLGVFEAEDEDGALEALAQDAGYQSFADMNERLASKPDYKLVEYNVVEADASEQKNKEETKMKKFKVVVNHFDMGIFSAKDERAALEAWAQDAGYQTFADMEEQTESDRPDEYEVVEMDDAALEIYAQKAGYESFAEMDEQLGISCGVEAC